MNFHLKVQGIQTFWKGVSESQSYVVIHYWQCLALYLFLRVFVKANMSVVKQQANLHIGKHISFATGAPRSQAGADKALSKATLGGMLQKPIT